MGWVTSEVVILNDATFEHQTQASSGATTGSWFLMLGASAGCEACTTLKPIFDELGQDETLYERSIVLGSVDVNDSPTTAMRFGIQVIPSLLYLHKGHVYRFPTDVERSVESMKEFVLEHYGKSPAEPIPPPPSALDELVDLWSKLKNSGMLFYAFLLMAGLLVGTIGVLIMTLVGGNNGAPSKSSTKKD